MSFLGSMMGSMAGRMAVPAVALGGAGAYQSGALEQFGLPSMMPSHYEMEARVVSVERRCRLMGRRDGSLTRTAPMLCDRAVEMMRDASFKGFELRSETSATYVYYTKDGNGTLTGHMSGEGRHKGEVIRIRVDAKDHSKAVPI